MDIVGKRRVGLPPVDGVIVKGFDIFDDEEQTIRGIIEAFQEASADYKVAGIIYPVGTKKDRAVVEFSNATAVKELIDIHILKIKRIQARLKIDKFETVVIEKIFYTKIDPVVACLLPKLETIQCETGVKYVHLERCFVSDSEEGLQILIDSFRKKMRRSLLERESGRGQLPTTAVPNQGDEDQSDYGSFVFVNKEDGQGVSKCVEDAYFEKDIIACCVVIKGIDSKQCDLKSEVSKFLQMKLNCENATVHAAEDHAIAMFKDEKDANGLLETASNMDISPFTCSKLNIPILMDGGKLFRVQPTLCALFPDISKRVKQNWTSNVIIFNDDEFIIAFDHERFLNKFTKRFSTMLGQRYTRFLEPTSQVIDRKSKQISTKPDDDSGTKLSHINKKESANVVEDEIPVNKSAEDNVSEEPERAMDEECEEHGDDEMDKTSTQCEPIQDNISKTCNSQSKKRKNTVTEQEGHMMEEDSNGGDDDNFSSGSGITKRPKKENDQQNLADNCYNAKDNQKGVKDHATQEEKARDNEQESEERVDGQGGEGRNDKINMDVLNHRTTQMNKEGEKPENNQREDTKTSKQNDVQVHVTSQSEIGKEKNKRDEEITGKNNDGQRDKEDINGRIDQISQNKIDEGEKQENSQIEDTKTKAQTHIHDHHTSHDEIEKVKNQNDDQAQQEGQTRKANSQENVQNQQYNQHEINEREKLGKKQGVSQGLLTDKKDGTNSNVEVSTHYVHHINQSQLAEEKKHDYDHVLHASHIDDRNVKDQNNVQDHTGPSENADQKHSQAQNTELEVDTRGKGQSNVRDHTSQGEMNADKKQVYGQAHHTDRKVDTRGKGQTNVQDHTGQGEMNADKKQVYGQAHHTDRKVDTRGKGQTNVQDHTRQGEMNADKKQVYGQAQNTDREVDIRGKGQTNVQDHTGQGEMNADEKQVYGQAHHTDRKVDTRGKGQTNVQDHTRQGEMNADKKQVYGQAHHTDRKVDTRGKGQTNVQDHTGQGEMNADEKQVYGQAHTDRKVDTRGKGQTNVQDHTRQGEMNADKKQVYGQAQNTDREVDIRGKGQSNVQDHTRQGEMNADKKQVYGQAQNTDREVDTRDKGQSNVQDHTRQGEMNADEKQVYGQAHHTDRKVDTRGKGQSNVQDHTRQGEMNADEKQVYGQAHHTDRKVDTRGNGQSNVQDHTRQGEMNADKKQVYGQAHDTDRKVDTRGKGQSNVQDHTRQGEMNADKKQVYGQAHHTDRKVDTRGKGQSNVQDDTRQGKMNADKKQLYGQTHDTDRKVDTRGKGQSNVRDHTHQGKINADEKHSQAQNTDREIDTRGKGQSNVQDHTRQGEMNADKKQVYGQAHDTDRKVDTSGKGQSNVQDHTRQGKMNADKKQVYGQAHDTDRKVDTRGKGQSNVRDHTHQGKINADEKHSQAQNTDREIDTRGKGQSNVQDHTRQGEMNADKKQVYGQAHDTDRKVDTSGKGQSNVQDHTRQGKMNADKKQVYGQAHDTDRKVDTRGKGQSNVRDHTHQGKINADEKHSQAQNTDREIDTRGNGQSEMNADGKTKHTGREVDTTGNDYTSQGKINTDKRQEYGKACNQIEGRNYSGQWNNQDQQTNQKKIDDREKQGNGQHHQTSYDDPQRVQAQNVIQGQTVHQRDCTEGRNKRLDNDGGKVKPTAAEKKYEVKQSQEDMRTGSFTVNNDIYQFLINYQGKKVKEIERDHNVIIKWWKDKTELNLAVLSNNDEDGEERIFAENKFIELYQSVSNSVKLHKVAVVNYKSSEIKRSVQITMQEIQNVLLLHKDNDVLLIGDENNVTQARKIFKQLLGITVEEKHLKKSDKKTENSSKSSLEMTVGGKINIIVKRGDITSETVDVIVNAANGKLIHNGGVAKAIAVKAGKGIDDEGQKKLRKRGSALSVSEVLHTGGYNLKAEHVIHAVGPIGKGNQFQDLLKKTFLNCLAYADVNLRAKTIAVPLISSGNFGGGKRECAKALANSVNDFAQGRVLNLKEVRLVNIDAEATQEIQTEIDKIRDIPRSQCSAVAEHIDSDCEMRSPNHPSIAEIDLSHAVLVEGFEVYKSPEKTKLNLVMFLPKYTNGGGEVEHVIYPVEQLPKKAVVIFSEQKVAESLISLGESTTKSGQTLLFKPIEVGHHCEAIILDINAIYPSTLLNRMPARCENLGDGRLLLESKEIAHVEAYINNELEKWLNSQVDGVDIKGKFSESQCVIVTGFEEHKRQEQTRDKLEIILTKQKNGGGDIEQIVYPFGNSKSKALAIFSEPKVARSLIKGKKMSGGKGKSLEIHPLEKKTLSTSQCVIVTGFKELESQERTRDALQITLQIKKKGGGDVDKILYPFGKSTNTAVALFSKTEVANSLIKAKTISDGKGQNLKIYPFKVGHQMKTFIFVFNEAVVQLEPTLKDDILRILDIKGEYLEDGWKLMLEKEDDLHKVDKHVTGRIQILLNSCIQEKNNQPGSKTSQQVDRQEFLVYQFFKDCHKDKVKEIERTHDVTITWMHDKNELAVQSNKPGDDTDRRFAEERFRDLYQNIHPSIKPLQVEDVHLVEAQKVENKITRKHADVLILPKEYVFIGSKDNVERAVKDFEVSLQHDGGSLLTDVEHTIGGLKVIIRLGDITNEDVDVIVNAANGELQHGSGVARAIAKKAGRAIHDECQMLLKKRRRALNVSEVLRTKGYNLNAKYVLHAVGPRHGKDHPFPTLLKNTFLNCLESADGVEATTIAIPLISSGVFGGKKEECAQLLYDSILNFVQSEECQNLKEIRLVNIDLEATTAIQDVFKTYSGRSWGNAHSMQTSMATSTLSRDETYGQNFHSSQTEKNESINSSQTSIHQNTRSKGQMPRIRDASKFEDPSYDELNKRNIKQEQTSNSAWQPTTSTNTAGTHTAGSVAMHEEEKCPICFDKLTETMKQLTCGHKFCRDCIEKSLSMKPVCPICGKMFGALKGNQPKGSMETHTIWGSLPGFERCRVIRITYNIPSGTQTSEHPHPGNRYSGTTRIAYLPDNWEGRHVAGLLRKAFDARLIFTIGTSITTGASDSVTWNDIHHKTSMTSGPNSYGYPDPNYLRRVQEELAVKGIK